MLIIQQAWRNQDIEVYQYSVTERTQHGERMCLDPRDFSEVLWSSQVTKHCRCVDDSLTYEDLNVMMVLKLSKAFSLGSLSFITFIFIVLCYPLDTRFRVLPIKFEACSGTLRARNAEKELIA